MRLAASVTHSLAAVTTTLLVGCGTGHHDLSRSMWFDVSSPKVYTDPVSGRSYVPYDASEILGYLRTGISLLGGSTSPDTADRVQVRQADPSEFLMYDLSPSRQLIFGYTVSSRGPILLGPDIHLFTETGDKTNLERVVLHELGHVLGAAHLPCQTQAIMAPDYLCWDGLGEVVAYGPEDVSDICGSGWTVGGVCAGRGRPAQ